MGSVFLLMGSNLGDRLNSLLEARQHISRQTGKIITTSSVYQTSAWGDRDQPDFYNQAIEIDPLQGPHDTLLSLLEIEKEMGRVRVEKWGTRVIDIDILLWKNTVINHSDLIIPHPHLHNRRFALVPLAEIAPRAIHPLLAKTSEQILQECTDVLAVTRVEL